MSDSEARRTESLPADVRLCRVNTGHGFHFEDPRRFVQIVDDPEARVQR